MGVSLSVVVCPDPPPDLIAFIKAMGPLVGPQCQDVFVLQCLQSHALLADTPNSSMAHTLQGSWVNSDGVDQGDDEVRLVGHVVPWTARKEVLLESTPTRTVGILSVASSLVLTKAPINIDRRSHILEFTHCIFYKVHKPNVLQVVMEVMFDCLFSAKMEGCYKVGTV